MGNGKEGTPAAPGTPYYNVDLGGDRGVVNLFEGMTPAEINEMLGRGESAPEEEPKKEPEKKKAVEEEGEKPAPKKAEEEKPKTEATPPPKVEAPPTPPKTPPAEDGPVVYKIKHRGQEKELSLTKDQLIARLQMAEDYTVKTSEVAERERQIAPYLHVVKMPAFQEWLKEQREAGHIETPPAPPLAANTEVFGYYTRVADPDFKDIHADVVGYAMTLPQQAQEIIATDYATYNRVYDQMAEKRRKKPEAPPAAPPPPQVDPKVQEKILAAKEKAKELAVVEKPGGEAADTTAADLKKKEKTLLARMRKGGSDGDNASIELMLLRGMT